MALPSYYISTSVTCVDTTVTSKILMLPPANTIPGVNLYIYDSGGNASVNPIYVSTQQGDEMDNAASQIILNQNYQSFRITPYTTTKYAIGLNYTGGLTPFQFALYLTMLYTQRTPQRFWASFASSSSGAILLGATNGGTDEGFYVSDDYGVTWDTYVSETGNFRSCAMIPTGEIMYVADGNSLGLYKSANFGVTWTNLGNKIPPIVGMSNWVAVRCDNTGDFVLALSPLYAFFSINGGNSFTLSSIFVDITPTLTACAMNTGGGYVYVTTSFNQICVTSNKGASWGIYGPTKDWTGICCSSVGDIVYASDSNGEIWKSTDYGVNWTQLSGNYGWVPVQCNANGNLVMGGNANPGYLYLSSDGGTTWRQTGNQDTWTLANAFNTYGDQFIAGSTDAASQYIYIGNLALS